MSVLQKHRSYIQYSNISSTDFICKLEIVAMPRHRSAKCLKHLVLDKIAKTVKQLAGESGNKRNCSNENYELLKQFLTPFNVYGPNITNSINFALVKHYNLRWPAISFFGSSMTVLNLSFLLNQEDTILIERSVKNFILVNCPRIEVLCLNFCTKISSEVVRQLITAYKDTLRRLELQGVTLSGNIFEAIGKCNKLSYLDISRDFEHSQKFSFYKLAKMFLIYGKRTGLARSLEVLLMSNVNCASKQPFRFFAHIFYYWCPQLSRFTHHLLFEALAHLCKLNKGPKPLYLKGGDDDTDSNRLCVSWFEEQHDALLQCVPKMENLNIISGNEKKATIVYIIQNQRLQLTTLDLSWTLPFGFLKYVGLLCPYLEHVTVDQIFFETQSNLVQVVKEEFEKLSLAALETGLKPWSKLKTLSLRVSHSYFEDEDITSLLKTICKNSSGSLKALSLEFVIRSCAYDVLNELFQDGTLRGLTDLLCLVKDVTPNMIWDWLTLDNSLQSLYIVCCQTDQAALEMEHFDRYIDEKNLDLKLIRY
ncbi:unnamed protein product [Clavelina lepadiformis]|uniref:Uncharacterized protein n=1 Tax=Clavelina lepadiformis TaxID=159417 RepID=A0ABP0G9C5_CLALP